MSKTLWKKDKLIREYQIKQISGRGFRNLRFKETFSISKAWRLVFERQSLVEPHVLNAGDDPKLEHHYDNLIQTFVFDRK